MPAAEGVDVGGLVRLTTPIWLLYRILLGSAFANIGACASVATFHSVAAAGEPVRMVGSGVTAGVGDGDGFRPKVLSAVVTFRLGFAALLAEIQVLVALFP